MGGKHYGRMHENLLLCSTSSRSMPRGFVLRERKLWRDAQIKYRETERVKGTIAL